MLTPDYLKNVSDDAERLYARLENNIIKDIVRRLKNTDFEMTESAKFQIQVAQESGKLYDEIIGEVSKNAGVSEKAVKKIFENSAIEALSFDDKIYKAHGLNPIPIKQSESMLQLLKSTLNKTNGSLYNLTLTTANTSQQKFIEVCNDAYMEISSGAFDYNTAISKAIKQFGDVQVEYDSGYKLNIQSAVKRAVMTGVNQTCLKMQEMRAEEMGCDLVEVTAHAGARPEHAEWQGKIYSRSGKSKKYPDLVEVTGYGTGPGLGGWNCRHNMFPYFEGTVRTYTDKELEELKPNNEESLQNDNENGIILTDEEKNAIESYTRFDATRINPAIRKDTVNKEIQEKINILDSALQKAQPLKEDMTVYRGTIIQSLKGFEKNKEVTHEEIMELSEKIISDRAFISTSKIKPEEQGRNIIMNIKLPKKFKGALEIKEYAVEKYKYQDEVLLKRNTSFFVNNIVFKDGKYYFSMEAIE